jgi:hypothetical protein
MGSVYGQHLYSENRYSWLTEWALKPCDPDVWYKTGYVPQDWALEVCNPAAWFGETCGPVPPNRDGDIVIPVPAAGSITGTIRPVGSLSGKVGTTGTITGAVRPVGQLSGVFIPEVKGTITGLLRPVGDITGKAVPPGAKGTIVGVVRPTGNLAGVFTAPPPWTPALLDASVLKLWLKASDLSTIISALGAVSQWNDKSGNLNNLTQATGTRQPTTGTTTINGKNTLSFDGDDTMTRLSGVTLPDASGAGFTVLSVMAFTGATSGWILFPTNAAASDYSWSFGRNGANHFGIRSYQGTVATEAAFTDNTTVPELVSGICTTTLRQIWQNGTSLGTSVVADATPHPAQRIYLGADNNPVTNINGRIAEVLVIVGTDATIRQKAEGYLAWEHGLVSDLAAGHPYKLTYPTA